MADIASNLLYNLVLRELGRQGLAVPARPEPAPAAAVRPKADKSALLVAIHAAHGPLPLLLVGRGVHDAGPEPTLAALLRADDPPELLARWQRLERHVHSRHRVRTLASAPGELRVAHVSLRADAPPHPAEDLLIFGLLVALFEAVGAVGLTAALGEAPVYADGRFGEVGALPTDRWRFTWTGVRGGPFPSARRAPLPFGGDGPARPLVERVGALVRGDCARTWTLPVVARALAVSPRTLQRRLGEAGTHLGAVVRTTQVAVASELLLEGRLAVSEIGMVCGFSDQAHFTRAFRARTNIPPARFRAEFAGRA